MAVKGDETVLIDEQLADNKRIVFVQLHHQPHRAIIRKIGGKYHLYYQDFRAVGTWADCGGEWYYGKKIQAIAEAVKTLARQKQV